MTYGQVKNRVLQLLNQYSVAGNVVASTYNNQADYILKIPALVNDAMMEIATTLKPIPARVEFDVSEAAPYGEQGAWVAFQMPSDCWQLDSSGAPHFVDDEFMLLHDYRWLDQTTILFPADTAGTLYINYFRYPIELPDVPLDTVQLDNVPETHSAIPFYVAAYLVIHDDSFKYATFYNKYEDKLAKMQKRPQADVTRIRDSYDFFSGE